MLTDIFAYRYKDFKIWNEYSEDVRRLLNQSVGILKEVFPYYNSDGKVNEYQKQTWTSLHDSLCRELGVSELSTKYYSYQTTFNGQPYTQSGNWPVATVCETFVTASPSAQRSADMYIKERLSLIELGLRTRASQVAYENSGFAREMATAKQRDAMPRRSMTLPGSSVVRVQWEYDTRNKAFETQVAEFNERLRRAGAPLAYHNGFIQVVADGLIEKEIAAPFWALVADKKWENVSIDLAEALDQRDGGGKDPAFYAAKALESTIKIISSTKGWTTGKETGAANFIDHLVSKSNGRFIETWEGDLLKEYFRKVRNPVGHGPGDEPMPVLNREQTNWAIETAMSWSRSLIRRL